MRGELDIVVYDQATADDNMSRALSKAHKQLWRIIDFIDRN